MAKNPKKVLRKIAVTFLFVGRFLRSIHQKTANYPRFTMRYRPERIRAAFGPYLRRTRFFDIHEVPKIAGDILPYFFVGGLIFHMRQAASESFFVCACTTYL